MKTFHSKIESFSGTDYREIHEKAKTLYKNISLKSKRRPYIRSKFFKGEKIFIDYFWDHLWSKNWRDRVRRLKFYPCAIDLIKNSNIPPSSKEDPNRKNNLLH